MTSPAEAALANTTDVNADAWRTTRANRLTEAVELMNQLASDMKAVPGKIEWSGASSQAAEQRFYEYGTKVAAHADTLAAVNAADAQASAAVAQAQKDYEKLPDGSLSPQAAGNANKTAAANPGAPDAAAQNAALAEERRKQAEADKQKLDSSMGSADSDLKSNVTWDFKKVDADAGGQNNTGPGYVPPTGGGSIPGGGNGNGPYTSVWQQPTDNGTSTWHDDDNGTIISCPPLYPPPQPPIVPPEWVDPGLLDGGDGGNGLVSVDGGTQGVIPGTGSPGGAGGLTGLTGTTGAGGGSLGGSLGGMGGVAGGALVGGAGLAAGVGGIRAAGGMGGMGGMGGGAGGRTGGLSGRGSGAAADGGLSGRTSGTGAGGRGFAGGPGEGGGSTVAGGAGGARGGMMGGGGGGGGAGGRGGGISGASSGKYGVPKLGAEGGRGGAAGGAASGRGGGANGGAAAGGRGSGAGGGNSEKDRDRTFLTEEDEANWYDGEVED